MTPILSTVRYEKMTAFAQSEQPRRCRLGFAFCLAVVLGACVTPNLLAEVIVVPNALATTNGVATSNIPAGRETVRYMMMHDASQFAALSGPTYITQFAFRPKESASPMGPRQLTMRIYASTTQRSVVGMSTTYSQNIGTDNTLVFDGTLTMSTENLPGPGDTRHFGFVQPFTTPFLYDPAAGNLVLDIQESSDDGEAIDYDAVPHGSALVRALLSFDSPTGISGFFAKPQVTQFTFETPPLVTVRTSQVEVCWNSKLNLTYQVQYRSELTANVWTSLGNCLPGSGSVTCLNDPIVPGQPQRFYRVVQTICVP